MEKHPFYIPPVTEVIRLESQEFILNVSGFGDSGSAGDPFDPDNILDNGLFNMMLGL